MQDILRIALSKLLSVVMVMGSISVASASALDDYLYETVDPYLVYKTGSLSSPMYTDAPQACQAAMYPPYQSGTSTFVQSNPRPHNSGSGLGCLFRVVETNTSTGALINDYPNWFGSGWINEIAVCPNGFSFHNATKRCRRLKPVECDVCVANPIDPGRAIKKQSESDYRSASQRAPLYFTRQYASWHHEPYSGPMGTNWFIQTFGRSLRIDPAFIVATRALASTRAFDLQQTNWVPRTPTGDALIAHADGNGSAWRYFDASAQAYEYYSANGVLLRIQLLAGDQYLLQYSDATTASSIAPYPGLLIEISSSTGGALNLRYNNQGLLTQLVDPAGHAYVYTYGDGSSVPATLLVSVQYPDTRMRTYHYEPTLSAYGFYSYTDPAPLVLSNAELAAMGLSTSNTNGAASNNLFNVPAMGPQAHLALKSEHAVRALTGITDESSNRFATWQYDALGRPTVSKHANDADKVTLTYNANGSVKIENALGGFNTYTFINQGNRRLLQSIDGATCAISNCGPTKTWQYNANGTPQYLTDWKSVTAAYTYNSRGFETQRTEAAWTAKQRIISTQWHATYKLPTQITEPGKQTTFTYDTAGNQLTRTETDIAASASRTWTYSYNAFGQVLTADGPRTDVSDVTTYTYYACTSGFQCGQVHTITNSLNQTTTYHTYNAHGQPLTITDPNGVVTTLTYDLRQRLTSRTVGTEVTSFDYWPTGLLKTATLPDGTYIEYTYDAAHRLTGVNDTEGNRITYTLDLMGNRIQESVYDPSNALTNTRTRVFNTLNRLTQEIAAAGTPAVTTSFGYDNNGNQTTVTAPLSRNSTHQYDELNRLTQVTAPGSTVTKYGYNALDQLISVTDPRNKVTNYTYNALGDLVTQVSPDTGTTSHTYDSAGNLLTKTDSRGVTVTHTYDALNRITQASTQDQVIQYHYDLGAFAAGRLSDITDNSGQTSWTYDAQGRIASKQQTMGALSKTQSYGYNLAGQLTSLTLPSGNVIGYGYSQGKVSSLTFNGSTTILSTVLYEPFGPTAGWTWGNNTIAARAYDLDGKVTDIDSAGLKSYGYDDAFRITGITDASNSSLSQSFGYDLLDRSTNATGTGLNQSFTYDANGNRLTQGGSQSSTFAVNANNNRLNSVSGALSRTYSYDNAGNTLSDGAATFTYDQQGRMGTSTKAGITTSYQHNALGQRVRKSNAAGTTYFVYDEAGHLIGEYDSTGALIQEIIWLGDIPVASVRENESGTGVGVFYIHTDHLNTPRKITRSNDNAIVWSWDSDPFGNGAPNEDPDGNGMFVTMNLRFPGQYFDAETGLHHNYFRDFDPATGRYVQSDPIGLRGGLNTYGYVGGNPVDAIDPSGLFKVYGYQNRGGGSGWSTQYQVQFDPLSAKRGAVLTKAGKVFNRIGSAVDLINTKPAGPKRPLDDYLECGLLDAKLQKEYEDAGFTDGQRLTRDQLEGFLNDMHQRYPEMKTLYPSPSQMLNTAEQNSRAHWFYQLRPEN